jgi:hypothetical protein
MRSKLLNADLRITYAVVLDTGDEVIVELGKFIREQEVEARLAPPRSAHPAAPSSGISSAKRSSTRKYPSTSKSKSCRWPAMSGSATRARPCISNAVLGQSRL